MVVVVVVVLVLAEVGREVPVTGVDSVVGVGAVR